MANNKLEASIAFNVDKSGLTAAANAAKAAAEQIANEFASHQPHINTDGIKAGLDGVAASAAKAGQNIAQNLANANLSGTTSSIARVEGELGKVSVAAEHAGNSIASKLKEGASKGFEGLNEIGKTAMGMFAGGALLGAVSGVGEAMHFMVEKAHEADEASDSLTIALSRSGATAEQAAAEQKRLGEVAKKTADDFGIPALEVTKLQAKITGFSGITGKSLDGITELALGASNALQMPAEAVAKMLAKGADEEQMGKLKSLGIVFDKNASAAERMEIIQKKLGPSIQATKDSTQDAIGSFDRIKNTIEELGITMASKSFDALKPIFDGVLFVVKGLANFVDETAIPAIEELFGTLFKGGSEAGGGFAKLMEAMKPVADFIYNVFVSYLKILWTELTSIARAINSVVVFAFNELINAISPVVNAFKNLFSGIGSGGDVFGWLIPILKQVWGLIADLGKAIIEYALTPIQVMANFIGFLINAVKGILNYFGLFKSEVKSTGAETDKASHALGTIGEIMRNMRGTVSGLTYAFIAIKGAITDFFEALSNKDIVGAIKSFGNIGERASKGYVEGWNKSMAEQDELLKKPKVEDTSAIEIERDTKAQKEKAKRNKDIDDQINAIKKKTRDDAMKEELAGMNDERMKALVIQANRSQEELHQLEERYAKIQKMEGISKDQRLKLEEAVAEAREQIVSANAAAVLKIEEDFAKKEREHILKSTADIARLRADSIDIKTADDLAHRYELIAQATEAEKDLEISKITETGIAALVERQKIEQKYTALAKKSEEDRTEIGVQLRIRGAQNAADAERIKTIAEAEKTYRAETDLLDKNSDLALDHYKKYLAAKAAADEKYLRETNVLYEAMMTLQENLREAFAKKDDDRAKAEADKASEESKKDVTNATEALKSKEISFADYQNKTTEAAKKAADAQKKIEADKVGFIAKLNEGLAKTLADLAKRNTDKATLASQEYLASEGDKAKAKRDLDKADSEIWGAKIDNDNERLDAATKARESALTRLTNATNASNDALSNGLSNLGAAVGLTFAKMAIDGKNLQKSLAIAVIEGVKAIIPALATEIIGKQLAINGVLGIATSGILTGILYGAASALESKLNFRDGVVNFRGKGGPRDDANMVYISSGESVITAGATSKNLAALNFINKGGDLKDYFWTNYLPQINKMVSASVTSAVQNKALSFIDAGGKLFLAPGQNIKIQPQGIPGLEFARYKADTERMLSNQFADLRKDVRAVTAAVKQTRSDQLALDMNIKVNHPAFVAEQARQARIETLRA